MAMASKADRLRQQADTVRALRARIGWTQEEAARRLHVTLRTYTNWEHGERPIPGAALELFQIKVAWGAPHDDDEEPPDLSGLLG